MCEGRAVIFKKRIAVYLLSSFGFLLFRLAKPSNFRKKAPGYAKMGRLVCGAQNWIR